MAVQELKGLTWLNVVWDGNSDYTLKNAILLRAVRFFPSAASDKVTIMQNVPGESDPNKWPFFSLVSIDGGPVAMFEPSSGIRPTRAFYTIDYDRCVFSNPSGVIIQFVFEA